jgi:hypothetical protein
MFNKGRSEQNVTRIIKLIVTNLVTPKLELSTSFCPICSLFVEQKLMISCSFRCDLVCNNRGYDFGHTFVLPKSDFNIQHLRAWGMFVTNLSPT